MRTISHIYTSLVTDESMKSSEGNYCSVLPTRERFLDAHDVSPGTTTLVQVTYDEAGYCRYHMLSKKDRGDGIIRDSTITADALITQDKNHALFLPLADCIGAVIHDPVKDILMLSHLGRHNLEQCGGTRSIDYLVKQLGCNPKNLTVWLSPAAGKENYPLYSFDNRSMHDVAVEQLAAAGISPQKITVSPIDTTTNLNYFSHSEFLKGSRENDGRFAIIAVMR